MSIDVANESDFEFDEKELIDGKWAFGKWELEIRPSHE